MNTTTHHRKAIIISPWWAGVIASIIASGMISCFAFVFSANAQLAVMQNDMNDIKKSDLPQRLSRMEEKLDWLVRSAKR